MSTVLTVLFFILGGFLVLLCLLILLQTGFVRLESRIGIGRDGFPPGKKVPAWSLPDLTGQMRKSPAQDHWQLLIFTNHVLAGFPELLTAIQELSSTAKELEIIILSDTSEAFCRAMVRGLNLQVPVVSVDATFYQRFHVRIMPFAFFVDPQGTVYWVGMAGSRSLLVHTWKLSQYTLPSTLKEA